MSCPSFVYSEGARQWMLRYLDIEEYRAERDARLTKAACASTWWTHYDICRRRAGSESDCGTNTNEADVLRLSSRSANTRHFD
jgi:hypothetical protein